ncbi:MAG: T9SS type A sorting domain-containing protein, partial [Flavobacteriaceae bacterium]|nr:T9SS type A sorting domain-containing protein [Flavobacteriaceae bacterium]
LNMLVGLQPSTTYSVQVAVFISGEWGPYGKTCTITTPISTAKTNSTNEMLIQTDFNAIAFPNPFANNFKLDVITNQQEGIVIKVYNMVGQIVETQITTIMDLQSLEIGEKYPSGVYNIIVSQGEQTKTIRVMKR